MKISEFRNEQIPVNIRHAIRDALVDRSERERLSTYALAEKLNSSQSTVYNALKHARFGRMFAEISVEWLGMSIEKILDKYGEPTAAGPNVAAKKAAGPLLDTLRGLARKLGWSELTTSQVLELYATIGKDAALSDLKRAGNMYETVNRDLLDT